MLEKVFKYHFVPILIACLAVFAVIYLTSPLRPFPDIEVIKISGKQSKMSGYYSNLREGDQAEIDFIGSIKNKNQLTIFGSSEFSNSPYTPFHFLPDSLGIQAMGIGHAYHQELSILCELLAAREHLDSAKVSIIISPGWFKKETGTNTEAFLEFVRPNFLNKIANDPEVQSKYKAHIGAYIYRNKSDFSVLTASMKKLSDAYVEQSGSTIPKLESKLVKTIMNEHKDFPVFYEVELFSNQPTSPSFENWEYLTLETLDSIESQITNNDMWVNDVYFSEYVLQSDGEIKHVNVDEIDIEKNEEFRDFLMLIALLKEYNVDCNFIIQPLNPYFYYELENYDEIITAITTKLDENEFPYLNLFVTSQEAYTAGILKDVMHLSDFGWMKINRFLYADFNE